MKLLLLLLLLFQLQDSYAYRTIISQDKRQLPDLDSACFAAYQRLSNDEIKCFDNDDNNDDDGSSDDPLNPDTLGDVCDSEFCMDVAKKLLEACKVWLHLELQFIWVRRTRVLFL